MVVFHQVYCVLRKIMCSNVQSCVSPCQMALAMTAMLRLKPLFKPSDVPTFCQIGTGAMHRCSAGLRPILYSTQDCHAQVSALPMARLEAAFGRERALSILEAMAGRSNEPVEVQPSSCMCITLAIAVLCLH